MYNLNRLRETFLIKSSDADEIANGIAKVRAQYHYPHYTFTNFQQSDSETIVQVWELYRFND